MKSEKEDLENLIQGIKRADKDDNYYEVVLSRCRGLYGRLEDILRLFPDPERGKHARLIQRLQSALTYSKRNTQIKGLRQELQFAKLDLILHRFRALKKLGTHDNILDKIGTLETTFQSSIKSLEDSLSQKSSVARENEAHNVGPVGSLQSTSRLHKAKQHLATNVRSMRKMAKSGKHRRDKSEGVSIIAEQKTSQGKSQRQLDGTISQSAGNFAGTLPAVLSCADATASFEVHTTRSSHSQGRLLENAYDERCSLGGPAHGLGEHQDTADVLSTRPTYDLSAETRPGNVENDKGVTQLEAPSASGTASELLRVDTSLTSLDLGFGLIMLLFQDCDNFINCVLMPGVLDSENTAEKSGLPRGKDIRPFWHVVCNTHLKAAPGSCLRAFHRRSRIYIAYVKEMRGTNILADAYIRFERPHPWDPEKNFWDVEQKAGSDSDSNSTSDGKHFGKQNARTCMLDDLGPLGFSRRFHEGYLQGRMIQVLDVQNFRLIEDDGDQFLVLYVQPSRTEYHHWTYRHEDPTISESVVEHWQIRGFRHLRWRIWSESQWKWFARDQGYSYFGFTKQEDHSGLLAELIDWKQLKPVASVPFWFTAEPDISVSQVSWESFCVHNYYEDECLHGVFFGTLDGKLFHACIRIVGEKYDGVEQLGHPQLLAPAGSVRPGTRITYEPGKLFFISAEGLLMVLSLLWHPSDDEDEIDHPMFEIGQRSSLIAKDRPPTDLRGFSFEQICS